MTKRYTGGVVSSAVPTVNAAGASGVYLLSQQADAAAKNNWPPFKVEKSLRFRSAASSYFNRTPSVASNQTTWTWSGWVKRGDTSVAQTTLFSAGNGTSDTTRLQLTFSTDGTLYLANYTGAIIQTSASYRDPAAWYHVVLAVDTTQSTSSNRVKLYINGSQVTAFGSTSYPTQNSNLAVNSSVPHNIGRYYATTSTPYDGYMAEINFVDGQQLTPNSFGGTDKDGNWSPISYIGTYGQNGFYLNFKDPTSTTTIGYDYSGNGNNWASSGISVTAGVTYDSMIDVPSDQSDGTANNRGNYCTINPLLYNAGSISYTNGNMTATMTAAADRFTIGNICASSGKFYWELTVSGLVQSNDFNAGICKQTQVANGPWVAAGGPNVILYNTNSGWNVYGATQGSANGTISNGDTIGVAMDLDANNLYIYKNGALFQTLSSYQSNAIDTTVPHTFFFDSYRSGSVVELNCGQRPFTYTPPTGFKTLNTFNLPEPTIKAPNKHFDATLYTGNGTTKTVTGINFKPDFVWIKSRSGAYDHNLNDAIRGVQLDIKSNTTDAEAADANGFQSFNSDGFTVGSALRQNTNGSTNVAWQWNAGGSTVTNTTGSISAQVRANPTAGFSIVSYTGTGSAATVGHGLGVAPAFYIVKPRSNAGGQNGNWLVYHSALGGTQYLLLNTTNAVYTASGAWNNTAPTSSVFSIGTFGDVNTNGYQDIVYCWSEIAGFSKFGSYTGNASTDGPFVYTGFRPKWILLKSSSIAGYNWLLLDTARSTYNLSTTLLYPNLTSADDAFSAGGIDILSNGFKIRTTSAAIQQSGQTVIYAAFAEMPFKYARSR